MGRGRCFLRVNIESNSVIRTGKMRKESIPYPIYLRDSTGVASKIDFIACGASYTAAVDVKKNLYVNLSSLTIRCLGIISMANAGRIQKLEA